MHGYITLYMNTGFNGTDIPANPQILEDAVKTVYPYNYFERMDVDLKSIDLKAQYEHVRQCDYLKFTVDKGGGIVENFYYRCIPQSIAKGVTRLSLELDALLTLGGAENLTYTSGWQERGHIAKADDTLFGNVAAESWVPSQELVAINNYALKPTQTQDQIGIEPGEGQQGTYYPLTSDLTLVVSNTDIYQMGTYAPLTAEVIEGIVAGQTEASMYYPSIPMVKNEDATDFNIWDYTDAQNPLRSFNIPNTAAYYRGGSNMFTTDAEHTRKGMSNLYSAGQLSLQASYQIPKEYVSRVLISSTKAGNITTITGYENDLVMSTHPYEYTVPNYTVKNKKCFSTFRTYTIASLASGDMIVKKPSDLYQNGDVAPSVVIWTDPCSTGKPYCRFKYIKGNPILWQDVVRGLQWQNSQIVIEGASGSAWNSINTAFANSQLERSVSHQLFNMGIANQRRSTEASDLMYQQQSLALDAVTGAIDTAGKVISKGDTRGSYNISTDVGSTVELPFGSAGSTAAAAAEVGKYAGQVANDMIKSAMLSNATTRLALEGQADQAAYNFARADADVAINKNGIELLKNNSVVAPTVSFTPEQNLGMYGYNYFVIYEVRKTDADLISEDMYYQRYGYNGLHRPLTQQCFKERDHYNYVQAFDINLTGLYNYGMRVNSAAIAQLNGGVRVWRELPNVAAYETN